MVLMARLKKLASWDMKEKSCVDFTGERSAERGTLGESLGVPPHLVRQVGSAVHKEPVSPFQHGDHLRLPGLHFLHQLWKNETTKLATMKTHWICFLDTAALHVGELLAWQKPTWLFIYKEKESVNKKEWEKKWQVLKRVFEVLRQYNISCKQWDAKYAACL